MSARCKNSACAFLAVALAGCSDKEVTAYRVPKDPAAQPAVQAAQAPAAEAPPALEWKVPPGWRAQAASGLRAASFLAPGPGGASADVSVVTFAGAGGDALANVNRWRGQLKLPPIGAEGLTNQLSGLDEPAGHFSVADIHGEPDQGKDPARILGAWLEQAGRVWFFKMMGPESAVESQKDAFLAFLGSFSPGSAPAPAAQVAQEGPARGANTNDLPRANFAVAPTDAADQPSLRWQAPSDWKAKPASAMRKGSYAVGPSGASADLAITAFPGDVGGLAANVNRWRGQVGLPPVADSEMPAVTQAFDANALHFTVVDVAGPSPSGQQRILAALVPWQGATWFFKLTGPDELVEGAKPAFMAFLGTVQPR